MKEFGVYVKFFVSTGTSLNIRTWRPLGDEGVPRQEHLMCCPSVQTSSPRGNQLNDFIGSSYLVN